MKSRMPAREKIFIPWCRAIQDFKMFDHFGAWYHTCTNYSSKYSVQSAPIQASLKFSGYSYVAGYFYFRDYLLRKKKEVFV